MNPNPYINPDQHPFDHFAAPSTLARILQQGGQGYTPTDGFHIYTELRTTQRVQAAEDERVAASYVKSLGDYVNIGASAASVFGVTLLEAQGEVLHFFKEGSRTRENLIKAIQFVYLFTREAYSELRGELGKDWQGLASSLDGGQTVVLRHSNYSSSSAISLSPSANRPAKRLLYGGTKARHLDLYRESALLLGLRPTSGDWHEMNLDRESLPFAEEVADSGLGRQLNEAVRTYRREVQAAMSDRLPMFDARSYVGVAPKVSAPVRLRACSVRCDLDGFSKIVENAFATGTIAEVVKMSLETIRAETKSAPRDNVVFEAGLFTGAIGLDRTFVLKPDAANYRVLTDLLGVTLLPYKVSAGVPDVEDAVQSIAEAIKKKECR